MKLAKIEKNRILKTSMVATPLGPMVAISDEKALYLCEFVDRKGLKREIEFLKKKTRSEISPGRTEPIISIEIELKKYFEGTLIKFETPKFVLGTSFQKTVWEALNKIPYGDTRSYSEIAHSIKKPTAFRAVALANSANQFAIIVPCHRVINANGELGGYAGGLTRKEWLISHENNPK
jgi:AraC family transcriptional regulator of adaptative response/methylated-DNA-[protein]-cysteine methyltransferase